ncbi:MAG: response regulator transcription factor, partial [Sediminibacterium sp.]
NGYYYNDWFTHRMKGQETKQEMLQPKKMINEGELAFLRLACTEKTYKEIAEEMSVSVRTVDGYRDSLFEKLQLTTRVGLVIYAIKNGIVTL